MLSVLLVAVTTLAYAGPYTQARGQNAPTVPKTESVTNADGTVVQRQFQVAAPADGYGNAAGNQFDLVVDGAFKGQTVAVLHFYTGEGFDFHLPKAALEEKGFNVVRWVNQAPPPADLRAGLAKASQLWIVSDATRHLTDEHIAAIRAFWDQGHGVYIWGDNAPYYSDANAVADALFHGQMLGDLPGGQTVSVRRDANGPGVTMGHDITTGLEYLFEGITIATLQPNDALQPLVIGSAGNLVTAVYDHGGKRAVLDGGFTRLYCNWDTAGTARYVKNAAAWLVNYERFGDAVVGANVGANVR